MLLKLKYNKQISDTYKMTAFSDGGTLVLVNKKIEEFDIDARFDVIVEFKQKAPKCGIVSIKLPGEN